MNKKNKIISAILLSTLVFIPFNVKALTKKETVYVNLDNTGTPIKTTVNSHLYNNQKGNLEDETTLKDILNINGEEKYTLKDNKLTWKADGKDIFYQGETDKETPISIKATYYLNGNETKVEDMIGKKGKVRIELEFTNNIYIYSNSSKIYTPFVTTLATMISDKNNSNFTISNGKAIDTGSKNVLVGIASPGLYESTNISEFKDLDNITITYDTTKFSTNEMYIVATPKLLEETDFDIFNKVDSLSESVQLLQENINKIQDGANELKDGSSKLSDGASEIANNLKTVANGLQQLEAGSIKLDSSIELILSKLAEAQTMLQSSDLNSSVAQLQALIDKNTQAINNMTAANPTLAYLYNQYNQTDKSEAARNQILSQVPAEAQSSVSLLFLLDANNMALNQTITSLTDLSIKVNTLVTELNSALTQVKEGTSQISSNVTMIKNGVNKLYNGSLTLADGANKLDNGVTTLAEGITKYNDEGISKLSSYASKAKNYSDKLKRLVELSKDYNGFTSSNSESTIFIYKVKK